MPSALFEKLILHGSKQAFPAFLYGTAWKKDKTAELVYQAICSGFRAVDTAAQPKHYREDLVGDGIRRALDEGKVSRDDLFVSLFSLDNICICHCVQYCCGTLWGMPLQIIIAKTSLIVPSISHRKRGEELSLGYSVALKSSTLHILPHFQVSQDLFSDEVTDDHSRKSYF